MDFDDILRKGNLAEVKEYLGSHIHRYGMVYDMNELLLRMTGEKFNPQYYIEYLKEKYEKLYDLK